MNHTDATRLEACEKYLLGELPPSLRAEFEEHYFGCAVCAAELDAAALFLAASRQVLAESPAPARAGHSTSPAKPWLAWLRPEFALPALAALLLLIGYQNLLVIPHWKNLAAPTDSPRLLHPPSVRVGVSRAAQSVFQVPAGQPFDFFLDVPNDPPYQSFMLRIEDKSGATRFSLPIPSSEAGKTSTVQLPSNLAPGSYQLVLQGLSASSPSGDEITRAPFIVVIPGQIEQH
ncbi:MAG TPA: zf-HC2 domain-containing protein [Terriglobales bacterium]|nr:zf-HC2 domain-containing protein [Terriglobales bacterium]